MPEPTTYQERREAKKFIDQRMRDLELNSYRIMDNLRWQQTSKSKSC